MEKYIELTNTNSSATHLKIEIYYNLGGYNVFTHKQEERGYYLSVSPVNRTERGGVTMESYTAFTGGKQIVKAVSRKSTKAEKEAETAAAQIEKTLVSWVCSKNGIAIPGGV